MLRMLAEAMLAGVSAAIQLGFLTAISIVAYHHLGKSSVQIAALRFRIRLPNLARRLSETL